MATYIKTLKEDNGDITYPQTKGSAVLLDGGSDLETVLAAKADASTVNQKITVGDVQSTDIVANAVTTAKIADSNVTTAKLASNSVTTDKIADGAVTSGKMDWASAKADPDVGDGLGWVYLGQTRLTAPASSLTFVFPKKYDNYKVIFGGELSSGSNTWNDFRFYNGATALTLDFQVQDVTNGVDYYGTSTNVSYAVNGNASQYDTINLELYSVKTASSQWRKYQGTIDIGGSIWRTRHHSGRLNSSTEPDRVTVITGGAYGAGAVLKVWGSDNA